MELNTIAKPYAIAISQIADANKAHKEWRALLEVGAELANDSTLAGFLAAPSADKSKKTQVLADLFQTALGRDLSKQEHAFVQLLLDNGRVNVLPGIFQLFCEAMDENTDAKTFSVTSAKKLTAQEKQQISDDLSGKHNATVSIDVEVDETLVGGVVIKEGDKVIDLSIKARLESLGSRLSTN